jgi:phosphotriesterase-related protein
MDGVVKAAAPASGGGAAGPVPGPVIRTVRGDIAPADLGFCQPHEHLFIAEGPVADALPALVIDDIEKTLVDVRAFCIAGGRALVDAQPVFAGRDAAALVRISKSADVHVIASTGFHKLMYYGVGPSRGMDSPIKSANDDWGRGGSAFLLLSEDELAGIFVSEIEDGMYAAPFMAGAGPSSGDDNGGSLYAAPADARAAARAGQIKTALEPEFTETHRRLFGAAARASLRTGAPFMIHVDPGAAPIGLFRLLTDLGVRPERQIYCHLDRAAPDIAVHRELAAAGAYIEYDTIARPKYHTDADEARLVLGMIEAGYAGRLLMSLDVTRERLAGYGGTPGLDRLLKEFIPLLGTYGVTEEILNIIFIKNPADVYSINA